MVSTETHPNHAISWVDYAASDLDAAIAYYTGLFGWTTFNDGETPYHIFQAGERPVGGVMALSPDMQGMPPVWSVYVAVADADAACAAATAAGGSVFQPPFEIPDSGRIAVIGDPAGAALCVFEGSNENGIKVIDEPGAPCWFEVMSRDVAASAAFCAEVFGWDRNELDMGEMTYTMFTLDGAGVAGAMALPSTVPAEVPSHWVVNFYVPDCDAAAEYVSGNGGTVVMAPMDTPFGRSCAVMDPWGAPCTLIDRSKADPENAPETA